MSDVPYALVALRDPITTGRLKMILKQRGWKTVSTSSSEEAISIYKSIRPRVVFLGIDLPPNDGHDTGLQIRAEDNQGRIVIITPKNRAEIANKTSISIGALDVLTTPIIASDVETSWPNIMGVIPPAPGLANFQPTMPEPPPPTAPPALPPPTPINPTTTAPEVEPRRMGRRIIRFALLVSSIGAAIAGAIYSGYIPI
tara:strand:- start:4251 stop:4847 length:597 start_codon:yes stop_codon:yes gene_type:complete